MMELAASSQATLSPMSSSVFRLLCMRLCSRRLSSLLPASDHVAKTVRHNPGRRVSVDFATLARYYSHCAID